MLYDNLSILLPMKAILTVIGTKSALSAILLHWASNAVAITKACPFPTVSINRSGSPFCNVSKGIVKGFLMTCNDSMKQMCHFDEGDSERFWRSVCMFDVPALRSVCKPDNHEESHFCQHMEYPEMGIDSFIESHISPCSTRRATSSTTSSPPSMSPTSDTAITRCTS